MKQPGRKNLILLTVAALVCSLLALILHTIKTNSIQDTDIWQEAREAKLSGTWEKALNLYEQCRKSHPNEPDVFLQLGTCHMMLGDLSAAESLFLKALDLNPESAWAYANLGVIANTRTEYSKGVELLQKALEIDPEYETSIVKLNLGWALHQLGRFREAEKVFDESLIADEIHSQAYINAANTKFALNKIDEGLSVLEKGTDKNPNSIVLWTELAFRARIYGREKIRLGASAMANILARNKKWPPQVTVLSLPFQGEWKVNQGNGGQATHCGRQYYCLDFRAVNSEGEFHAGEGDTLKDYFAFAQDLTSPADGTVVVAIDHHPDNKIGSSLHTSQANYIVIRHGKQEYTHMVHIRQGSAAVREGQAVKRGQKIAECGNSGYGGKPHLHIGLFDGPNKQSISRPIHFSGYRIKGTDGKTIQRGVPTENTVVSSIQNTDENIEYPDFAR